jgi:DNA invertase Pin-like site-specific DNA recombinase
MNIREQVFYGRQSVDKKDSISIESQFEFCQYELKGEQCKKFTDKGYSGKNMDRPQFQAMIREIEQGFLWQIFFCIHSAGVI